MMLLTVLVVTRFVSTCSAQTASARSLVGDPFSMREELTASDRRRLRNLAVLDNPAHEAWRLLDDSENAHAAFRLLRANP